MRSELSNWELATECWKIFCLVTRISSQCQLPRPRDEADDNNDASVHDSSNDDSSVDVDEDANAAAANDDVRSGNYV